MEANECETRHLDSDVLLPPRKRLLVGMKRRSPESTPWSFPESPCPNLSHKFNVRLNNLIKSHKNGTPMSPEEIAKAAETAAVVATKTAEAAKAIAEEKGAIAAKALATAKQALELVASFEEEGVEYSHSPQKKNKMKKQVPVQLLYRNKKIVQNGRSDEELARNLHRAINSSPRISKHLPRLESKNKHKKRKILCEHETNGPVDASGDGNGKLEFHNGRDGPMVGDISSEDLYEDSQAAKGSEKSFKSRMFDLEEENDGEAGSSRSEKHCDSADEMYSNVRKRGRNKQKKLPLSFCSFKDQSNPREEMNQNSSVLNGVTHSDKPNNSDMPPIVSTFS